MRIKARYVFELYTDGTTQSYWEMGTSEDIEDVDAERLFDLGKELHNVAVHKHDGLTSTNPEFVIR